MTLPFLYLPDALSLLLLWIALVLLRQSAESHCRLELAWLEHEARPVESGVALPQFDPALMALQNILEGGRRCVDRVSPARLFFVDRCFRGMVRRGHGELLPDPFEEFDRRVTEIPAAEVRERLRHYRREMDSTLGVFLWLGSLSGWVLMLCSCVRILLRAAKVPRSDRLDWSLDVAERLISRQGRRSFRLAQAISSGLG